MICPNYGSAHQALIKQCYASKISPNLDDIPDGKFPTDVMVQFFKASKILNKL